MSDHLTEREREALVWIATGKSDWEIGEILGLSPKTVNYHVQNAKLKLGTRSRVQAIALALRDGIIPFPAAHRTGMQPNRDFSPDVRQTLGPAFRSAARAAFHPTINPALNL
jgi:DNA-binding CsgD family transcriptional regulator